MGSGRFRLWPILAIGLLAAPESRAAELTAFMSGAKPGEQWGKGFGGALGITLLNTVGLELQGARQNGETADSDVFTLSGRAYLQVTIRRLVPYGGLAAGYYHQGLSAPSGLVSLTESGVFRSAFLGAKFKLPLGIFARGEYEWTSLPNEAPLPFDARFYLGAGITF